MLPTRAQGNIDRSDQSFRSKNSKDGIAPRHRRMLDRRNGSNSRCFDWRREITTLSRTPEVTCDRESWATVGSLHVESGRSSTRLITTPVSSLPVPPCARAFTCWHYGVLKVFTGLITPTAVPRASIESTL